MNKDNPRIFIGRGTMLGDILATLPTLAYLKKRWPKSTIVFAMGKKSASAAMLYLNHPLIDEIYITDGQEALESERDFAKFNSCDIKFNLNPQHRDSEYPNRRNIYLESFHMQGIDEGLWEVLTEDEKIPKLYKWWNSVKRPFGDKKTILFTGMPNFGRESKRWVSKKYLEDLLTKLIDLGYCVIQSGGEQDKYWFSDLSLGDLIDSNVQESYFRINEQSFFEQIQIANECDCIVGSDSGMSLILGAYNLPQVSLIPIHWGNHNNPSALSTNNPNNYSFYSHNGTDDISQELVIDKIKEKLYS
jgi:ADP-heptose:LPS heptosyltransferase